MMASLFVFGRSAIGIKEMSFSELRFWYGIIENLPKES